MVEEGQEWQCNPSGRQFISSMRQLRVKTLCGKQYIVPVEAHETIGSLKKKLYEVHGLPPDQQRLVIAGNALEEEDRLLEGYCSEEETTVFLLGRLRR